jgi:hypothetical protein
MPIAYYCELHRHWGLRAGKFLIWRREGNPARLYTELIDYKFSVSSPAHYVFMYNRSRQKIHFCE